jgi:tRNA U34 5-methylaminomethyl-2-thiouridine-forming methyltransferase MnmC
MKREIIETADGSKTLFIPEMNENYHSGHGALQEAIHVFIENGVRSLGSQELSIFEMGFGTGLNALLAMDEAIKHNLKISYTGIDAFPIAIEQAMQMDYERYVSSDAGLLFKQLHSSDWGVQHSLNQSFTFRKLHEKIEEHQPEKEQYDLLFFDAFGPRAQSAMWEMPILNKMHEMLKPNGLLVTYCAKGQFKRDLKSLGFEVFSLPGPPGKREMTQAFKRN